MWIGGYSDWTPAEQREWDKDLEDYEKEIELNITEVEPKTPREWAWFNPLYKAYIIERDNPHVYNVVFSDSYSVRTDVVRDIPLEVGYAVFAEFDPILRQQLPKGTSQMKLQVNSRKYNHVEYTCYCTPATWSFTVMEEIMEGLNEQLISPIVLALGLDIQVSFVKN